MSNKQMIENIATMRKKIFVKEKVAKVKDKTPRKVE